MFFLVLSIVEVDKHILVGIINNSVEVFAYNLDDAVIVFLDLRFGLS